MRLIQIPDVEIEFSESDFIGTLLWDGMFASDSAKTFKFTRVGFTVGGDREQKFRDWYWAYGGAEDQPIQKLYAPIMRQQELAGLRELDELTSLSFEHQWINPVREFDSTPELHLKSLVHMKKLKTLVLDSKAGIRNLKPLAGLPLEELVFNTRAIDVVSGNRYVIDFKASYFPTLKRLTAIHAPSKTLAKEIAGIESLASFTLVDPTLDQRRAEQDVEKKRRKLASLFPDKVDVEVISMSEYLARTPDDFLQHLQDVRQQVRDKYNDATNN